MPSVEAEAVPAGEPRLWLARGASAPPRRRMRSEAPATPAGELTESLGRAPAARNELVPARLVMDAIPSSVADEAEEGARGCCGCNPSVATFLRTVRLESRPEPELELAAAAGEDDAAATAASCSMANTSSRGSREGLWLWLRLEATIGEAGAVVRSSAEGALGPMPRERSEAGEPLADDPVGGAMRRMLTVRASVTVDVI